MGSFYITVIQLGKTKASYLQEAEKEYIKRLGTDAKLVIITLKDAKAIKNAGPADIQKIKEDEGENILKSIPPDTFVIALDEKGKQFTSPQFAEFLGKKLDQGNTKITFVIGGCYGLSEKIRNKADMLLSFSQFTFTHEMMRPLLYEQLFRALSLIKGEKYHY